jgi:hypothetical protein
MNWAISDLPSSYGWFARGAALGGVIIGVQQLQIWGTGWARRDDAAWELLGVGFAVRAKALGLCIICGFEPRDNGCVQMDNGQTK